MLQAERLCTKLQKQLDSPLRQAFLSVTTSIAPNTWLSEEEFRSDCLKQMFCIDGVGMRNILIRYPQAIHYLHQAEYIYAALHQVQQRLSVRSGTGECIPIDW